jgi:hypothetical protein
MKLCLWFKENAQQLHRSHTTRPEWKQWDIVTLACVWRALWGSLNESALRLETGKRDVQSNY